MKTSIRMWVVLVAVTLSGFVATAEAAPDCGLNTGKKAAGAPIPIGSVSTTSGVFNFREASDAAKAYFDCVNANGGIHGRPITYLEEDDQGKLDVAAQAAKKLVGDKGVYAMVGGTSVVSCVANAGYYTEQDVLDVGVGIPPQCFLSKNIGPINAGPRASGIAAADYARRKLGAKSVVCTVPKFPGSDWICGGVEEWGKKFGVKVTSIYTDPVSPDVTSLVLQLLATGADAAVTNGVDEYGARLLQAAQQQDGAANMKWTAPTSYYTVRFPKAIDTKYWNDRFWVNAELAPLDSNGKDNQNWLAVMAAFGGKAERSSFSQAGYLAARVVVGAMLNIKNPKDISRKTVTAAIQNANPYATDILCAPWYWGGPGTTAHNANHTTQVAKIHGGNWQTAEGCTPVPDPALAPVLELEKKLGIGISDKAK